MTPNHIAIAATVPEKYPEAKQLAASLHLDWVGLDEAAAYDYLLLFTPHYLGLQKTADKKATPFYIDFLSAKMRYRSKQANLRNEWLARALGCKPIEHPAIIDATAGLGRDSFILATLGFEVTMIERSPILCVLLQDALQRAKADPKIAPIMDRLHLHCANAYSFLSTLNPNERPDIIYLDPMFPERKKSAAVKKDMLVLQDLLGSNEDASQLLELAVTCANRRVVVKRPRLAASLTRRVPSFSMTGKSSRFDIYLTSV